MAWVNVPGSNNTREYEDTATSSDTYPDAAGTYSGGIRTYTKPGTSDTVTVYARTRVKGEINLVSNSEDFTAWTNPNGVTITPNATIAPDDSLNGTSIIEKTNTAFHLVSQPFTTTKNQKYTVSVYAKYNGRHLQISLSQNPFSLQQYANFNLQTGTLGTKGAFLINHKIENVGNGWYRCSITSFNAAASVNSSFAFSCVETDSAARGQTTYLGDGVSGIFLWGGMLNESEYIRRYIKTTNSASTTIERGELSKTYYDAQ